MIDFEHLADLTGQAVSDSRQWHTLLATLSDPLPGEHFSIHSVDLAARKIPLMVTAGLSPYWSRQFSDHYAWVAPASVVESVLRMPPGRSAEVQFDSDFFRSEYYDGWMAPQDIRRYLAGVVARGERWDITLTVLGTGARKAFSPWAVALHTHALGEIRAAFRAHSRMTRALGSAAHALAWEVSPQAVALLNGLGQVVYLNPAAERLLEHSGVLASTQQRLAALHGDDPSRLNALIHAAVACDPAGRRYGGSLSLGSGMASLAVEVHPLNASFGKWGLPAPPGAAAIAFLNPGPAGMEATPEWLRARYGLTQSEARLAMALATGVPLRQAAESVGIAYGTARNRLLVVFEKTGVRRQAELVKLLLTGAVPFASGAEPG